MGEKKKNKYGVKALLLVPMYATALILVLGPLIYMVYLSFMTRSQTWGFVSEFTLDNYIKLWEPLYRDTFVTSLKLALLSTGLIVLIGYPFGYFMARLSEEWKRRMMLLIMLPFWTSSLIRLYGWIIVFRSKKKGAFVILEALKFFASRLFTLAVDILIMFLLVDLTGIHNFFYEFGAKIISTIVVLVLNYILSKLFVFRKKKEEKEN